MNMRYGSSLNPKWVIDALWTQRKVIFFAISAASIAGNAVVLVESLGIDKACISLLNRLLPQLRKVGEVLVQRPVLYTLLNLIMLSMVVKSGVLGGGRPAVKKPDVREAELDRRMRTNMLTSENFDEQYPAEELQASVRTSHVSMKGRANTGRTPYVYFKQGTVAEKPGRRGAAAQSQSTKQTSLFTIEPLETLSINSSMSATHNLGGAQIMGTAQLSMGAPQLSIDTAHCLGATQLSIPTTYASGHFILEPQIETSPVLHDKSKDEDYLILRNSDDLQSDSALLDDHDLNRQQFNERVETFISKFKRSLTMQRQDSFNRLLELVGVGVKRS